MIDKNTIYSYFQTDDFPTEEQFRATWDSFWHKSESIPVSQITGLNQLFQQTATVAQLNDKANVDGSNIDVSAYQEKLNITNLIATAKEEVKTELLNGAPKAFDTLKEISDWISDDETAEAAILQAIQNEATARTEADNQKLNKPTTTSNTASYPYVVGEDGNGNSARLPAGDLGKNFFNSDLSNTTARNHTMNAGVTVNTLGNPHTLSGLPNKNTDIANFRKVRVQNTSGLDSVVDSKNLLTDGVTSMSDAEKDAWRLAQRKTGENYSTGQPRVDLILPFSIDGSKNYIQYISIVGLNLFLNTSSSSTASVNLIRYKDINGNLIPEESNIVSVVEVSQTQPSILSFGFNFLNFNEGYYKVAITHNGLTNLSSPDLIIKDNLIYINNLPNSFENNIIYADSYTTTNTSVEKIYNTSSRGLATVEQFSKIKIIPASAVLQGVTFSFDVSLNGSSTTEPGNVINRTVNEMGLSYDKDLTVTGNLIDLSFRLTSILSLMGLNTANQTTNVSVYTYRVFISIYKGFAKMTVINLNNNAIYTNTKAFQQLDQDLYFMVKSYGSGNISNIGQFNATKLNILLNSTYQQGI